MLTKKATKMTLKKALVIPPQLPKVESFRRPQPDPADVSNLAKKVMASARQGSGKASEDLPKKRLLVLEYIIKLEDGSVLYAEGKHADVLVQFLQECENVSTNQNFAMYTGPALESYTAEEWAAKNQAI